MKLLLLKFMAVDMALPGWARPGPCGHSPGPCGHSRSLPVPVPPPGGAARRAHRAGARDRAGGGAAPPWERRGRCYGNRSAVCRHGDRAARHVGPGPPPGLPQTLGNKRVPPHKHRVIVLIPLRMLPVFSGLSFVALW